MTYLERHVKNFLPNNQCNNPRYGDGQFDPDLNRWIIRPCRRKNCPRHWKTYARRKYHQLKLRLDYQIPAYHVILFCRHTPKKGQRLQTIPKLLKQLQATYNAHALIAVKHKGRKGLHLHVTFQTTDEVEEQTIKDLWKKYRPFKRQVPWDTRLVYLRQRHSPYKVLWYSLGLSKRKPRINPPWQGLRGNPVSVVVTRR